MKILVGIVAVIACFCLVEALDCNRCLFSIFGQCIGSSSTTCSTNTSVCYASRFELTDVSSASISKQGCAESSICPIDTNATTTTTTTNNTIGFSTFFTVGYKITNQCCNTDKCNSVTLSGASATSMSLSVVLSAAALAVVGWSHL